MSSGKVLISKREYDPNTRWPVKKLGICLCSELNKEEALSFFVSHAFALQNGSILLMANVDYERYIVL
jgi:hypothetical protein